MTELIPHRVRRSTFGFLGGKHGKKYYIQCKDVDVQHPFAMSVKNERAIIQALIKDQYVRKNQKIVVKLGPTATIWKEYRIGEALKDVPGFIRYICAMQCEDNLDRYKEDPKAAICDGHFANNDGGNMNVLIMPYYSLGHVREYAWEKHPEQLRSCLKQIILSMYIAFTTHGFVHSDLHMENVLLSNTQKEEIVYNIDGKELRVSTYGLRTHIMDLEYSFMPVHRGETKAFYSDMDRMIKDLKYGARIEFLQLTQMSMFTEERCRRNAPMDDIWQLYAIIDGIQEVQRQPPPRLVYDPAIYGGSGK